MQNGTTMHFQRKPWNDRLQLYPFADKREIQDDDTLHPDGIRCRTFQRDEKIYRRDFLQDPQLHP